jgi:threonine dehydratase
VSATRGNHGQSLAYAAAKHGVPVCIVVPFGNSREKNAAMRALGAELIEAGEDFQAATEVAMQVATERGWRRVPSFHLDLVAGVGTWALELLEAAPQLQRLYVPIGLGSGMCGAIAAKRALSHDVELVGVVSTGAPAYALSLAAGQAIAHAVSTQLADGMACRATDPTALTLLLAAGVRMVQVSDEAVAHAMRLIFSCTHNVAEGAGAAGLAALLADTAPAADEAGFVLCGGNVDSDVMARVLSASSTDTSRQRPNQ